MVWYTWALLGASKPGRPRSFAGRLRIGAPEGVPLAGPRVVVGPVAPRSAALPAGPLERGVRSFRPSWVVPDMLCRFDRGSYGS
ncbi:unnamed protein product [Prunus armeniaca]